MNQDECIKDGSSVDLNCAQPEESDSEMVSNSNLSVTPKIVYSDSAGSDNNENTSSVSQDSTQAFYIDIQESSTETDDSISSGTRPTWQNLSSSPKDISDSSHESDDIGLEKDVATKSLQLPGLRIVEPRKSKRVINQATLAQAALSAVLETEESPSSDQWFEGENKGFSSKERKPDSFDNRTTRVKEPVNQRMLEPSTQLPKASGSVTRVKSADLSVVNSSINSDVMPVISDHAKKKALGHSRSKSDHIRASRSRKQVRVKETEQQKEKSSSLGEYPKLSTSLPANSGLFFM